MTFTARIYKIENNINDEIYVGSTTKTLAKRMSKHRYKSKQEHCKHRKLYEMTLEHGWECFRIILIEEFKCESKQDMLRKEQEHIDLLKPTLNKLGAFRECPHGRQWSVCKECGGTSICEHERRRHECKECNGASICEHERIRKECKECDGASICKHERRRSQCKECHGGFPCPVDGCNKLLSSKGNLKRHIKNVHKQDPNNYVLTSLFESQ